MVRRVLSAVAIAAVLVGGGLVVGSGVASAAPTEHLAYDHESIDRAVAAMDAAIHRKQEVRHLQRRTENQLGGSWGP